MSANNGMLYSVVSMYVYPTVSPGAQISYAMSTSTPHSEEEVLAKVLQGPLTENRVWLLTRIGN